MTKIVTISDFKMKILTFLICIILLMLSCKAVEDFPLISLSNYNIRPDAVTLSGFSSGSSMATQFHISHSRLFHGVALFSQSFYRCGPNSLVEFGIRCSQLGQGIFPYDIRLAIWDAKKYEGLGLIDPLRNLNNQRVFIWTGELDEYVPPDMAMDNAKFYGAFISNKSLISANLFEAKHLLPTTNFGEDCDQVAGENVYLGNCNYSGAYHALDFLLRDKVPSPLINPFLAGESIPEQGSLMAYNQSEFYPGRNIREAAMGEIGFIYIPKQCQGLHYGSKKCFLHINFHGCEEWPPQVALRYIRNNGFLPVADANGIITVFPLSTKIPQNMNGCWDFFSYTGPLFATKEGTQIKVVKRIVDRILGKR